MKFRTKVPRNIEKVILKQYMHRYMWHKRF